MESWSIQALANLWEDREHQWKLASLFKEQLTEEKQKANKQKIPKRVERRSRQNIEKVRENIK